MVGKKYLNISVGCIATILAAAGIWLPGLPTVPFLLVALWAFGQSSERLHKWLIKTPLFKSAIHEAKAFEENRTLSLRVKIISQTSAWLSVVIVTLITHNVWVIAAVGLAALACSIAMYAIPTRANKTTS